MLRYLEAPALADSDLNDLFAAAWPGWEDREFQPVLRHSLGYVAAFDDGRLVGFVNVAWDGGGHAFLLDTTVHPDHQRRGIGTNMVKGAVRLSKQRGAEWLHVDFEQHLAEFYARCGFRHTAAGLIQFI